MREILFRGKRLDTGEWAIGDLSRVVHDGGDVYVFPEDGYDSPDCYEVDPKTVGQYTGLKDADGNRIFEGDILEAKAFDWRFVVEWDDDNGRFLGFTLENERKIVYVGREPKAKIVGSIHDRRCDAVGQMEDYTCPDCKGTGVAPMKGGGKE